MVASPALRRSRYLHRPQENPAHEHPVGLVLLLFTQRPDGWGKHPSHPPDLGPRLQPWECGPSHCRVCPGSPVNVGRCRGLTTKADFLCLRSPTKMCVWTLYDMKHLLHKLSLCALNGTHWRVSVLVFGPVRPQPATVHWVPGLSLF